MVPLKMKLHMYVPATEAKKPPMEVASDVPIPMNSTTGATPYRDALALWEKAIPAITTSLLWVVVRDIPAGVVAVPDTSTTPVMLAENSKAAMLA